MKKTFYMMRHGQTLFNQKRKIQGSCDSPLTELGIQQAKAAREILKEIPFDCYYASTAERASDTLEIVTDFQASYIRLKGLKERDFGLFEGETEDLNPKWENGYDEIFPKYGGESNEDVLVRVNEACKEIMEKENHNTVLAVSHAGACFHFLRKWADPALVFDTGGFTNCCILKFEYEAGRFTFLEVLRPKFN